MPLKRINRDEALRLLTRAPLIEVMARGDEARQRLYPEQEVSFVVDTNPNYTNVCITDCTFCSFYRKPGDATAWTLGPEEIARKAASAQERGATTVLLQGGAPPGAAVGVLSGCDCGDTGSGTGTPSAPLLPFGD